MSSASAPPLGRVGGALLALLPLQLLCCCPRPRPPCPPCATCATCAPCARCPAARPVPTSQPAASQAALTPPPHLKPRRRAPFATLGRFLDKNRLHGASFRRFHHALTPHLGATIRWRLRSWGREISARGYDTPGGRHPPRSGGVRIGRIRLISPTFGGGAGLAAVRRAGHPVISCLARFPPGEALFVRSDGRRERAPDRGVVTIEGTLWGVRYDGGPALWLFDCALVND